MCGGGFCQLQSWKFAPSEGQVESDRLSLYTAVLHNPMWFVGQKFVLMQNNDPKRTSKLCQRYIKRKEEHVLELMSWLVQPVELNPIEMV